MTSQHQIYYFHGPQVAVSFILQGGICSYLLFQEESRVFFGLTHIIEAILVMVGYSMFCLLNNRKQ
jgi:hypothetical protein